MPNPHIFPLNNLQRHAQAAGLANAKISKVRAKYRLHGGPDSIEPLHDDDWEFAQAMDQFKRDAHKPFPSWSEALAVLKTLGYHR